MYVFGGLRQCSDPVEKINHVVVVRNHRSRIITGAEQTSGFILEITVGKETPDCQNKRLEQSMSEGIFQAWRKNNAFAKGLVIVERLRGDDKAAVGMIEVASDKDERAAPIGDGDFHRATGEDFQKFVQPCSPQNIRSVAIATREWMRAINLRRCGELAVVDSIEMLRIVTVGGVREPIAVGDVGENLSGGKVVGICPNEKWQRK